MVRRTSIAEPGKPSKRRGATRVGVGTALLKGDARGASKSIRGEFDKQMDRLRISPDSLSNTFSVLERLKNPADIKAREKALGAEPHIVRNPREIGDLLKLLESGELTKIERWLAKRAEESKAYWKQLFGIARGRRPNIGTLSEYGEWAWLRHTGMSYREIAEQCLPGTKQAEDKIRHGVKAYNLIVPRLLKQPNRK